MLSGIDAIFSEDVEKLKKELQDLTIKEFYLDMSLYGQLSENIRNTIQVAIENFNKAAKLHNTLIKDKVSSPFDNFDYTVNIGLASVHGTLNASLTKLENERTLFNKSIKNLENTKRILHDLNDKIAYYAIIADYQSYKKQQTEKNAAGKTLSEIKYKLLELEKDKATFEAQKKSVDIAYKEINKSLKYIFFSDKRLELISAGEDIYHLKSNGRPVTPDKISCGERNALALCYFFTDIAQDMDAKKPYSDEMFLVVDDPVSSFDLENKIGVLSFLRWKFGQIINECAASKILIMSHDLGTVFDLEKAFDEIFSDYRKLTSRQKFSRFGIFKLENKEIKDLNTKEYNEYTMLLKTVFDYAKGDSANEIFVGNSMRRVLEAFSTFIYKKGIVAVSQDESTLSLIVDEREREYFKNLMYRLVLHGESHYENHMKKLQDMNFFNHLPQENKKRTAQEVLCFMYRLNKSHILAHLPNGQEDLKKWLSEIKSDRLYFSEKGN